MNSAPKKATTIVTADIGVKGKKVEENHLKTIMVVERDIVRKLIIPRDKNRKSTTILSESQFDRIKKNSRVSNIFYYISSSFSPPFFRRHLELKISIPFYSSYPTRYLATFTRLANIRAV